MAEDGARGGRGHRRRAGVGAFHVGGGAYQITALEMIVHHSELFKNDFQLLPKEIQDRTVQKLLLFTDNERHPSLHIKKMQGRIDIWEGRISIHYRFTFDREGDAVHLRRIGTHDILSNP